MAPKEDIPRWSTELGDKVDAILKSAGRENLPVLHPGDRGWPDRTTATWFCYFHDLDEAIPEILYEGWDHDWLTYRDVPDEYKERWFLKLVEKCTWSPRHSITMYHYFNAVARKIFRNQMRMLRRIWARDAEKLEWMKKRVWTALTYNFEEFGTEGIKDY